MGRTSSGQKGEHAVASWRVKQACKLVECFAVVPKQRLKTTKSPRKGLLATVIYIQEGIWGLRYPERCNYPLYGRDRGVRGGIGEDGFGGLTPST